MIDPVALGKWIARDQSDFAHRVREAIAPSIADLAENLQRLEMPCRYVPMARRNMQPYVRKAWRSHDPA